MHILLESMSRKVRKVRKEGRKEGNVYLTTHSTHFICDYMASDIW